VEGYMCIQCPVTPSIVTGDVVNTVSGAWRAIQVTWKQARSIDEWPRVLWLYWPHLHGLHLEGKQFCLALLISVYIADLSAGCSYSYQNELLNGAKKILNYVNIIW